MTKKYSFKLSAQATLKDLKEVSDIQDCIVSDLKTHIYFIEKAIVGKEVSTESLGKTAQDICIQLDILKELFAMKEILDELEVVNNSLHYNVIEEKEESNAKKKTKSRKEKSKN